MKKFITLGIVAVVAGLALDVMMIIPSDSAPEVTARVETAAKVVDPSNGVHVDESAIGSKDQHSLVSQNGSFLS